MGFQEKIKTVKTAIADIEKQFGRGAIMLLGGEGARLDEPISVIPSGSIGLDRALGVGGLPKGRIIEIFGPESSGKTTLALHAIASVQREGGVAAFVDAEHALDPRYAQGLGLNLEELLVSQPDHGEQALEIVETLIRSGAIDLVVVDSVAALVPKAEIEGEMGDTHMGLQARLMSQAMRKLTGHTAKTKSTIIFINQTRNKIGVVFGSPETTTGGNALKFYASVRLEIRRTGSLKEGETVIGNQVRVKVVKNKVAPPFREAEFEVLYGKGVSTSGELLDLALERNIIEKSGAWYAVGGARMGQGREQARQWLEERPPLMSRLRAVLTMDAGRRDDLGPAESWGGPNEDAPPPASKAPRETVIASAPTFPSKAAPSTAPEKAAAPEKASSESTSSERAAAERTKDREGKLDSKAKPPEEPAPATSGNGHSAGLRTGVARPRAV